jgi:hypothetical protein
MSGQTHRILPITEFTQAARGGATTQRVAQRVDVSQWASAEIMTRVHSGSASGEAFNVVVYADGYTTEDPAQDFQGANALATVDLKNATTGDYDVTSLSGAMGSMLMIQVEMSSQAQGIQMAISIDLALRDA